MIEMDKKYRTRDGREVRIYAVDGFGQWPVHGAVSNKGHWISESWTKDGWSFAANDQRVSDLIEVKPEVTDRYYLYAPQGGGVALSTYNTVGVIGSFAVTHDGEKLIRVEIV